MTGADAAVRRPGGPAGGLRRLAGRAAGNSPVLIATTIATTILRFGSNLVLVRFLTPEAFGIALIATTVCVTVSLLSETGITVFVVRHEKAVTPRYLNALWTVMVARGFLLFAAVAGLSPVIAGFFGQPEAAPALAVYSATLALMGLRSLAPHVVRRQGHERRNAIIELSGYAAALPALIGLALYWESYWALIWGGVLGEIVRVVFSYVFYPSARHRLSFDRAVFSELWVFSRLIAASTFVNLIVTQLDRVLVAKFLPLGTAGVYGMASSLTTVADTLTGRYSQGVYMPQIAEGLRRGPATTALYYDPMRVMRPFLVFLCAGGVTFGPKFFELLFPPAYHQAGVFLAFLCIRPMVSAFWQPAEKLFLNNSMQRQKLVGDVIRLVWMPASAIFGYLQFGLTGLLVAVAASDVPMLIYYYAVLFRLRIPSLARELPALGAIGAGLGTGWLATLAATALFG